MPRDFLIEKKKKKQTVLDPANLWHYNSTKESNFNCFKSRKKELATALIPHPQNGRPVRNASSWAKPANPFQAMDEDQKVISPGLPFLPSLLKPWRKLMTLLAWRPAVHDSRGEHGLPTSTFFTLVLDACRISLLAIWQQSPTMLQNWNSSW